MTDATKDEKVWDPLVRWGHWILAIAFFAAYLTEDDVLALHVWAGYTVGAIVIVRIIWGFVGPSHARFSDFLYSPRSAAVYLLDLMRGRARRYLGHSPAGAAMVYLLLTALAATTWSGLMVYAYEEKAGPLAGYVAVHSTSDPALQILRTARADDEDDDHDEDDGTERGEDRGDFWEEVHELGANLTLLLVVLHISGVALAGSIHRENLVKSMLNGRKRAGP